MGNHDGAGRAVDMSNPSSDASRTASSNAASDAPQTDADTARNPANAPPRSTPTSSETTKPQSSELDQIMDASKSRKTARPEPSSSTDDNDLDHLLEGQNTRLKDRSDDKTSAPSSMDGFGEPATQAATRDDDAARVSSSEFAFEAAATGRLRVADTGTDPGPDEGSFAPAASATQRMAVSSRDVVVDESSTSEVLTVIDGREDRLVIHPGEQPVAAPSGRLPLSDDSEERIPMRPDPAKGEDSLVESYGTPFANADERIPMRPDPAKGEDSLVEPYGTPVEHAGERIRLVPLPGVPELGSVLETYGMPAIGAAERVGIWPASTQSDTPSGIDPYGEPSKYSSDRMDLEPTSSAQSTPEAAVSGLESYGTPSRKAATRIEIHEKPDLESANSVETAGHPSSTRQDRAPLSPVPDAARLDEARTVERYGDPTTQARDRVDLAPPSEACSDASLEQYGRPHAHRSDRMDLDPEPISELDSSSLTPVGSPLTDRSARIPLEDKPESDPENSTMDSVTRTSRDRADRVGRIDSEGTEQDEEPSASALSLSTDAADRFGHVDPSVLLPSPLPDIGTSSILEAGRVPVKPFENSVRSAVPNGLEGIMPDPRLRGHDRMRLTEYEEYELPPELVGKIPIPPRVVQVEGRLPETERYGACGDERVLQKEVTHRRMDFLYQRYEELHVRRRYYHCPFTPEEPVYKCREPRFVAGLAPLGNGLLAQLLASIYDDHSSVTDQAGILDRLGFTLDEKHIETGIDNATAAMQPILAALHDEFEAGDGRPSVDKKPVDSTVPGPKNRPSEGQLLFASRADAKILIHLKQGESHPLIKDMPPSRRKGELIQDLFRERVGYNREGVWAGVRRRFTLALATSPREAAYALFLIHAINAAASPAHGQHDELVRRSRSLRAWLDDQREQFDDPDNPLQRAVVYTLSSWDRMRFVDDTGDGAAIPAPDARGFPKNYVPLWTFDTEAHILRATTWYSLIHTCRLLGIRPWEYLYDCFSALSKQEVHHPAQWTPAAWARTTRA